jgi:formylglycine-generating enzyme required for sulfatase activity
VIGVGCAKIVGEDYRVTGSEPETGAGSCPTNLAGPALVAVPKPGGGTYCVDSTEVTNGQYQEWLDSGSNPALPLVCVPWKTDHVPDSWAPTFATRNLPVTRVDWCDAYAYCSWAKKRLCGAIEGGAHPFQDPNNPLTNMWFRACTAADGRSYPYGTNYDPSACVGPAYDGGAPLAVGSVGSCAGGYPGLFDLAGNVNEWEDSCNGETGESDSCRWRGGSFQGGEAIPPVPEPSCLSNEGTPDRSVRTTRTGFRCCL